MNLGQGQPLDLGQLEAMEMAAQHQARMFAAQVVSQVHQGLGTPPNLLAADIEDLVKYLLDGTKKK